MDEDAPLTKIMYPASLDDGTVGDPVEVEMRTADVEEMRSQWKRTFELPEGDDRFLRLRELRFQMDIFAAFPGTTIVRPTPLAIPGGSLRPPVYDPDPEPLPDPEEPEDVGESQQGLFDVPAAHARTSDPWTSHAAARSLPSEKIRKSQEAVLATMRDYGFPIDDTRLIEIYRRDPEQSQSGLRTRRAELVADGLVRDSGETTVLPSGRRAILWEVV